MPDLQPDQQVEEQLNIEEPKVDAPHELEPEEQALANLKEEPEVPENLDQSEQSQEPVSQDPQGMSRRKAKRLEKLEGLVQHLRGTPQQQQQPKPGGVDYQKMIDADPEVYAQLNQVTQSYGQEQFNAGLSAAENVRFHTRLEIDAPRIESKYPQFDKDSPEFNPGLASAVNEWYLATVGYDPQTDSVRNAGVRYANFVEGIMELADAMAGAKTTRTTENIARQAANAGLRPDGSSAKPLNLNKAPQDMSNDELNAAITASMPRDSRGRFTPQR